MMRSIRFRILLILFITGINCLIIAGAPASEEYEAHARFIQKQAAPGDIITLRLDFKPPPGFKLPDKPEITGLKGYDIVKTDKLTNGISVDIFVDRLEAIKLPALEISLYGKDNRQKTLKSNPASLPVEPLIKVKPSENLLRPIKELISTGLAIKQILLLVLTAILILLIITGVWFYFKQRKNIKSCPATPALPPHVKAVNRIDALVAPGIPDGSDAGPFCFELSEILREYMEALRDFNALEMTTHEISEVATEKADIELLKILKKLDLVKFANTFISASSLEEQVRLSMEYINKTKPGEI
jgi:hypothetical protein